MENTTKRGRKAIYINDVGVTLSVQVPSKQKERFRQSILNMRKEFEIERKVCTCGCK